MRSREFAATAGIAFVVAALSFTIAAGPSALTPSESLSADAPRLTKPIYCPDRENRQFSNIHHAWVCRTELAPG